MVLGNFSIIRIALLTTIFSISSCAQADISLSTVNGKCSVTTRGQSVELELTPPCELVKIEYKDHDYHQYNDNKVFIVAGQPAQLDKLTKWSVIEKDRCSLQSQAVIINKATVRVAAISYGSLTCPNIGLDEKFYRSVLDN